MSSPTINVSSLGKEYIIGRREKSNENFREMLTSSLAAPFRRLRRLSGDVSEDERIWALKDVSFGVNEGEVVGIIGANGAGKSTLLKILSRITEPTEGRAEVRGRVGSLLEVGTGFHPELTGRENIYLNGAVLGMKRREIDRKFDEIVDFSGLEKFLDTPLKRYSSGMQVRLGFSVAAHLEPEILIVDEVLAVGDIGFQKRCLQKMDEVSRHSGRTVILVSHNLGLLQTICERSILFANGRVTLDSTTPSAISAYLAQLNTDSSCRLDSSTPRRGKGPIRLEHVRLLENGRETRDIFAGSDVIVEFGYRNPSDIEYAKFLFTFFNETGTPICHINNDLTGRRIELSHSQGVVSCLLPRIPLNVGRYRLAVAIHDEPGDYVYDAIASAFAFSVIGSKYFTTGRNPNPNYGNVVIEHEWK